MRKGSSPWQGVVLPWACILTVLLGTLVPCLSWGAGQREFADGWLLDPADMAFILSGSEPRIPAPDGSGRAPQGESRWGFWAGAGQGRLFSMRELPLMVADCGVIRRRAGLTWALAGSWERLGEELMVEETAAIRLRLGNNPRLGARVGSRRWLVDDQLLATHLGVALEGRLAFGMGSRSTGAISFWWHPGSLPPWHGRGGRRTLAEIKLLQPGSGLALRIDQRSDGAPVLSVELLICLAPGLGLGVRADPETGCLGGNLAVRLGGPWWHSSHLVHPALGTTHRIHLGTGDPAAAVW